MPTRRLPNSIPAVLRTLTQAREAYGLTPVVAERAISAAQFAQINGADPTSLLSRMIKEAHDVDLAQAAQAPLSTESAQFAAVLTMNVSHFHQVLDLGIARGVFAPGARSYYGRDVHATKLPDLSSYEEVLAVADAIIQGETDRQSAESGTYVAMALPSAAEVLLVADVFRSTRQGAFAAEVHTDTQREEVQALYVTAQPLAVDICDTVEFFYRHDPDASSRRAKCERWGVVYMADGEPVVPEPPTPPTP